MDYRFGSIETILASGDITAIFSDKDCFPEEINPTFLSTVVPVVKEKLTQWVENTAVEVLGDATSVCKQITALCSWTAIWSKDPLPATMFFAACMGALWGIPKFRNSLGTVSREEFKGKYPEFDPLSEEEQLHLYHFRNALHFGFVVVKAYRNKGLLIDLVPRLSESRVYTLGGGIGPTTQRRVLVYEREGNIPKRKQPIRVDHVMRLLDSSIDSTDPSQRRDLSGFNFFNQFDIEVPTEAHHSDHGHYSHSYRSKDEVSANEPPPTKKSANGAPPRPPEAPSKIGRVVEFLSHVPEDGVTIRTVSIRNDQNEELARHAGIMQIPDGSPNSPKNRQESTNSNFSFRNMSTASNVSNFSAFAAVDEDVEMDDIFVEDFSNMNHRDAFVGSLDDLLVTHNMEFNHSLSSFPAEALGAGIEYAVVPKSIPLNGTPPTTSNANLLVDPQEDSAERGERDSCSSVLEDFMFDVGLPVGEVPIDSRNHSTSFSSVAHNGRSRMSSADYASLPAFRHNSAGSRQPSVDGLPGIYMPPVSSRATKLSRKINRCQSREDFYLVESVEKYLLSSDMLAPCPAPEDPITDRSNIVINAECIENPIRYPAASLRNNDDVIPKIPNKKPKAQSPAQSVDMTSVSGLQRF